MPEVTVQPQQTTVEVQPDQTTVEVIGSPNTRTVFVESAVPGPPGPPGSGLADPGANGIVVRTALNTTTARTLTAGTNVSVSNGDGVSGNPTVNVPDASTTTKGAVELATDGEVAAGLAVQADDSRLSDARTPTAHASTHVTGGTDKIRDATAAQDGLMTAAYASKLDGVEAGADVTDATNVASAITGSADKTTPADTDVLPLVDSVLKKLTWANIKATLKTYFDTLYNLGITELTGDVAAGPGSGSQAATLQSTAISGKTLLTPLAGTEEVLINDAGTLKKTTTQDIADLAGASGITQLTGDVTAGPGNGSQAATIANDAVTYAKMQNVSAASRLLGRGSAAGSGDPEEIVLGTNLTMSGTTLNASGGIGGSTGATDNAVLRADGTGGATLQNSAMTIADDGKVVINVSSNTGQALFIQGTDRGGYIGNTGYGNGIAVSDLVEVTSGNGFSSSSSNGVVGHFMLRGDTDANVASLQNCSVDGKGTNPQTLRIYETYPSSGNYERLTISAASGTNVIKPEAAGTGTASKVDYHLTAADVRITSGTGSPEGVVTAPVGTTYHRTDGGSGTTVYIKESGVGNTGWVAIAAGGGSGITELTGDVTAGPGTGSQAATIPNDTVTYAKMQNVSAASRLLGRGSAAGSGDPEEIVLGTGLTMTGTTLSASGGGSSNFTISPTPPVSPTAGLPWFNSENGTLYVYYDDGDSQQWVAPDNGGGEMTTLDFVTRWCGPNLWQYDWPADGANAANGYYVATVSGSGSTVTTISGGAAAGGCIVQTNSTSGSRARAFLGDARFVYPGNGERNIDWSKPIVFFVSLSLIATTDGQSWVKLGQSANTDGDLSSQGIQVRIDNTTLYAGAHDGTTLNQSSGVSLTQGFHYNVAVIGDGSNYAFYLNDTLLDTLAGPTATIFNDGRYAVECYNGSDSANQFISVSPFKIGTIV
jgi:hypothetical protein